MFLNFFKHNSYSSRQSNRNILISKNIQRNFSNLALPFHIFFSALQNITMASKKCVLLLVTWMLKSIQTRYLLVEIGVENHLFGKKNSESHPNIKNWRNEINPGRLLVSRKLDVEPIIAGEIEEFQVEPSKQ